MARNLFSTLYQRPLSENVNELTAQAKLKHYFDEAYDPTRYPDANTQLKQMSYDYNVYLAIIETMTDDSTTVSLLQQLLLDKELYKGALGVNLFNATVAKLGDSSVEAFLKLLYKKFSSREYKSLSNEDQKLNQTKMKPLTLAIQHGSVYAARRILALLESHELINACTNSIRVEDVITTPLHLAVASGSLEMVEVILKALASAGNPDLVASACLAMDNPKSNLSALCLAAQLGLAEIFAMLVQKIEGFVVDQGATLMHLSAAAGSVSIINQVSTLVGEDNVARICEALDSSSSTPLHLAVKSGSLDAVIAIAAKLEFETTRRICLQPNQAGLTPLHLAATISIEVFTLMLSFIDKDSLIACLAEENFYSTLFYCAINSGSPAVIHKIVDLLGEERLQCLVQYERDISQPKALFLAIKSGSLPLVNQILKMYGDYQEKACCTIGMFTVMELGSGIQAESALHLAVQFGYADIVKKIVQVLGQHVSAVCLAQDLRDGNTALHLAAALGSHEIVSILLSALGNKAPQACIQFNSGCKSTPLKYAILSGSIATVEVMLSAFGGKAKDACRSICANHAMNAITALGQAMMLGHIEMVKKMLSVLNDGKIVESLENDDVCSLLSKALTSGFLKVEDLFFINNEWTKNTYPSVIARIGITALQSELPLKHMAIVESALVCFNTKGKLSPMDYYLDPMQMRKLISHLTPSFLGCDIFGEWVLAQIEKEPDMAKLNPLLNLWLVTKLKPRLHEPMAPIAGVSARI